MDAKHLEAALSLRAGIDADSLAKTMGEETVEAAMKDCDIPLQGVLAECMKLEGMAVPRTFDNAAIKVSNGNTEPQTGKTIRLVNGANFHGQSLILYEGSVFAVSGKSAASINGFYIGNPGSALSIDDSRVTIRGEANFSAKSTGGTFVFKGENPVLYFGANAKSLQFVANNAPRFILEVPAGGFAAPIISCASNDANNLFDRNGKTTGTVTFSIAGGSQCPS